MNREVFQHIAEVFERVRGIDRKRRAALLERECDGDGALREHVELLLRHHEDESGAFGEHDLDGGLAVDVSGIDLSLASGAPTELSGEIGSYRILRRLGEGGMGTVYEAEQEHPRRRVALKVIRPGVASDNLLRRFELEWQTLGRLQHPGIAQIYEAGMGATEHGPVPFFAMELVEGEPLLRYATARDLDLRGKLGLVARICDAVEHAHRRGVIHRDLKPENILVDAAGQPKVLDFGVARAVDAEVRTTLRTSAGELVGTVTYMSPEQAMGPGDDIDTRSDVYALGVIAYELLCGRLPYELEGKSIPAAVKTICEDEPAAISRFEVRLAGDVEAMVLKALEKEKERRYQSAAALAGDLRRFLNDEPITARQQTNLYRLAKFARRHRTLVAGVAATALALVSGTVVSTWLAIERGKQRRIAVERSDEATVQAEEAAKHAEEARRERDRAVWTSAKARLRVAGDNIMPVKESHHTALRNLEAVPEAHRDWEWRYLRNQVRVLVGHREMVTQLGFSPSGERLLTLSSDGACLWDARTLERIAVVGRKRGTQGLWHFSFSPVGGLLCFATPDEPLRLRDGATGAEVKVLGEGPSHAACVAFSPDGRLLAAGATDGPIAIWDVEGVERVGELTGHRQRVHRVAFDSRGWRLVSGGMDGTVRLWDVEAGAVIGEPLTGHTAGAQRVAFNRDGTRVASCAYDGTTRLWDVETGRPVAVIGSVPGRSELPAFAFSPDGARLVASSGVSDATLSDSESGRQIAVLHGHRTSVLGVAYSPEGDRIYTSSYDGDILTWDGATGAAIGLAGKDASWVKAIAVSPDGALLASTGIDNAVRLFDTGSRDGDVLRGHFGVVSGIDFSRDGSWLATGGSDRRVCIWCAHTLELVGVLTLGRFGEVIQDVAVAGDGARIAASVNLPPGNDRRRDGETAAVWDPATGEKLFSLAAGPLALEFSPDGRRLAGGVDGAVHFWDARTGELVKTLPRHRRWIYNIVFSPDGGMVAVASADHTARVWECESGREVFASPKESTYVHTVAFSPDGQVLAAGGREDRIRLWNLRTGERIGVLEARSGFVDGLLFLPGGERLVSAGFDGSVRFWSVSRMEGVFELFPHEVTIFRIAASPDGTRIATASVDGTTRILDSRTPAERFAAKENALRRRREAEPLVARLLEELGEPPAVAERLREDPELAADLRQEALKQLLRQR